MALSRDNETDWKLERNMVKNPNWLKVNQLAKHGQGFELGTLMNKSS